MPPSSLGAAWASALGSFLSAPALGQVGLRRHYVGLDRADGRRLGSSGAERSIWLAVPFVIGGAAGNGAAVVCNRLFVQRGAPDRYRGRALATLMSSTYAVMGVGMAAAGVLTDAVGARAVWIGAGCLFLLAALVALVMTRWLPVVSADEQEAIASSAESAVAALSNGHEPEPSAGLGDERKRARGLERIATLLEEIEARRERESRRTPC